MDRASCHAYVRDKREVDFSGVRTRLPCLFHQIQHVDVIVVIAVQVDFANAAFHLTRPKLVRAMILTREIYCFETAYRISTF